MLSDKKKEKESHKTYKILAVVKPAGSQGTSEMNS